VRIVDVLINFVNFKHLHNTPWNKWMVLKTGVI